jgi:membrane associated rhomboid family serine protease
MGLSDREYYREPDQPGFTLQRPQSVAVTLVIINAAIYLVDWAFFDNGLLQQKLSVFPRVVTEPWLWWKFLSSGFAHANFQHILWNMFALWMFGRDIERKFGPQEFLRFYLVAIVLGSVVWSVTRLGSEATMLGASGAVTAVVIAYCRLYPKRTLLLMMVVPVPAWLVGVLIVVLNLVGSRHGDAGIAYEVHLVGAAFGFFYCKFGWNLGRLMPFNFSLGAALKTVKSRPKLRIHDPGQQGQSPDAEADRVLDKMHRLGADQLTESERRVLEEYSRRMRQKHS